MYEKEKKKRIATLPELKDKDLPVVVEMPMRLSFIGEHPSRLSLRVSDNVEDKRNHADHEKSTSCGLSILRDMMDVSKIDIPPLKSLMELLGVFLNIEKSALNRLYFITLAQVV